MNVEVYVDEDEEKGKNRKRERGKKREGLENQKKPSLPKPGNLEKNMEYTSRVIQLRGSRPQGPLVLCTNKT